MGGRNSVSNCKAECCPECYNVKRAALRARLPTLAECNHPLLKDWDTEANAKEGLFPDKLRLCSHKHVPWVCHKCPLGLTHKYTSKVYSRALAGIGCSCCGGRTACKCNSLPSLHPGIAQEWGYEKNDGRPSDYTARSSAVFWWSRRFSRVGNSLSGPVQTSASSDKGAT